MILRTMLLLALLVMAPAAKAHSPLVATMPADGAVLAVAPDSLQLTFNGTASLHACHWRVTAPIFRLPRII